MLLRRKPFYFLRHGHTDWNAKGLCQGQMDVPLNETGVKQAHDAEKSLAGAPIATICCSPLRRARQTADIVNETLQRRLVVIDDLKEIYFAAAEGKPLTSHAYDVLLRSAEDYGGEPFGVFVARAIAGVDKALSFAHGGVFCAVQSHIRIDCADDITNCVPVFLKPHAGERFDWSVRSV